MLDDLRASRTHEAGTPLPGRESEQAALSRMVAELVTGRGGKVLVSGDAGIGKTSLVREAIAAAGTDDTVLLAGHCYEMDVQAPYAVWREALQFEPGVDPLVAGTASSGADLRRRVLDFLHAISSSKPLIVLLEDLQWADESSLSLLRHLVHQQQMNDVLIIVTCRDRDLDEQQACYQFLPVFIREARPLRLALRPLGQQALGEIVRQRYADLPVDDRDRLVTYLARYSEGNPFFANELLGLLEYREVLSLCDEGWTLGILPEHPVPPLVRQVIDSRLIDMDTGSIELLEIAAVFGMTVTVERWCAASGASPAQLAGAIDRALAARVIEELPDGTGYRFRHALVRGVLYERLNAVTRRTLHQRVAEVLAGEPGSEPAMIAHHFVQAGAPQAADWLIEAGRMATLSFALRAAASDYERALDILERRNERLADRTWLLCALAEANRYTDIDAALGYINRALATLDQLDDRAIRVLAIWCRARIRGFNQENVIDDLLLAAAEYDRLSDEEKERITQTPINYVVSQATLAQDLANYGRYHEAREHALAFLDRQAAQNGGASPLELGNALFGLGMAAAALGDPRMARDAFARSRDYFTSSSNFQMLSVSLYWELSFVAQVYDADEPELRRDLRVQEIAANRRSELALAAAHGDMISTSETLILDGGWEACRRIASARLPIPASRVPSVRKLAHLDWLQGYPERAMELIRSVMPYGPDEEPGKRIFLHRHEIQWIAAELALDSGDLELARRWIEAHRRWAGWCGAVIWRHVNDLLLARYHRLDGDLEAAAGLAQSALERASTPRQPLGIAAALRELATIAIAGGNPGQAAPLISEALEIARTCQAPWEIAASLVIQAEMLVASGLDGDALRMLAEARALAEPLSAQPLLTRIEEIQRCVIDRARGPVEVPFGLSPRELEVLRYVAQGYTDARIAETLSISPRTVGGHLQSILNKTGTSSRTAATALAFREGILGGEG